MFSGPVITEWIENSDREMAIVEYISFIDSAGLLWEAFPGDIIDGGSIPRFFWRFIGSPFVGYYRRATVIHDVYCKSKTRDSEAVHKVFKEMCLADGVSKWKAALMYRAVKMGGPKFKAQVSV